MEKIFAPEESRELIRGWLIHARKSWKKHEEAARQLEAQYRYVGIASLILSAVVGASIFSSLEIAFEPWGRLIAGVLSIVASVLTSLITFQRYEERTEKHRAASVMYKAVLRKLEEFHEELHTEPNRVIADPELVHQIRDELDNLEKLTPVVNEKVNQLIERRFEAYKFVAEAEDLRPERKERK